MLIPLLIVLAFLVLIGAVGFVFWAMAHAEREMERLSGRSRGYEGDLL